MVWTVTTRGKRLPLSLESAVDVEGEAWGLPHFADCPDAKEWSRRGK